MKNLIQRLPNPLLTIENKGSTARDHLANERTFLAWLRTAITLVTIGVALSQLSKVEALSGDKKIFLVGLIYSVAGELFLIFGLLRYFRVQNLLLKTEFSTNRFSIILCSFILLVFSIALSFFLAFDGYLKAPL